jgi:hypothetical protein
MTVRLCDLLEETNSLNLYSIPEGILEAVIGSSTIVLDYVGPTFSPNSISRFHTVSSSIPGMGNANVELVRHRKG